MAKKFTESDIEAGLTHVFKMVFPWIPAAEISHQTTFSIKLGHKDITISNSGKTHAKGRCDILLSHRGKPLAVVELKKPTAALTEADAKQGLSYARLLEPPAPITIVTNGSNTNIYTTYTGQPWIAQTPTEKNFSKLLKNCGALADKDLRDAISILMGENLEVWPPLIRELSNNNINRLTGELSATSLPFARNFLIPRKATADIFDLILQGHRSLIITGTPLSGKSNVLRELFLNTIGDDKTVTLYLNSGSASHGIFQELSNLFSLGLGWNCSVQETRNWLRSLSRQQGVPLLVLALDVETADGVKTELDELKSSTYGDNLCLVTAINESNLTRLIKSANGLSTSAFGNRSKILHLEDLDNDEFSDLRKMMRHHRVAFAQGAHHAREYRVPWVVRSLVAHATNTSQYDDESQAVVIPSIPGIEIMSLAKSRFAETETLRGAYSSLARAIISALDEPCGQDYKSCSINTFLCPLETARAKVSDSDLVFLKSHGFIKEQVLNDDTRVIIPQLPELIADSIARLIAIDLRNDLKKDTDSAAGKLIERCTSLPFGDLIGAHALMDAASTNQEGLHSDLFHALIRMEPNEDDVQTGFKAAIQFGDQSLPIEYLENGKIRITAPDGISEEFEADPQESPEITRSNTTSWIILSHIASFPIWKQKSQKGEIVTLCPILLEIGSCPFPLLRAPFDCLGALQHQTSSNESIIAESEGIIEPITQSLLRALSRPDLRPLIMEPALESKSLPLLGRILIALRFLSIVSNQEAADWANKALHEKIFPLLRGTPLEVKSPPLNIPAKDHG